MKQLVCYPGRLQLLACLKIAINRQRESASYSGIGMWDENQDANQDDMLVGS